MYRFIESILLKDGQYCRLRLHEARMHRTCSAVLGLEKRFDLTKLLPAATDYPKGTFKCRIVYKTTIEKITIQPYTPRPIRHLKVVKGQLDYSSKFENRLELNQLFAQRGDCDDVLIIKNGLVTDASYTNVAFFDGKIWWTPTTPLLKGVQRQFLLDQQIIQEKVITEQAIPSFEKIRLFNAMMDWDHAPEILINQMSNS